MGSEFMDLIIIVSEEYYNVHGKPNQVVFFVFFDLSTTRPTKMLKKQRRTTPAITGIKIAYS